ncbi:MAG: N-acetylmuramoyl-L-alanine amidase [Clostridia bacterium]|nr:N-acetylmuramoyl-L-alanine amidase [Clostridia bacterium]
MKIIVSPKLKSHFILVISLVMILTVLIVGNTFLIKKDALNASVSNHKTPVIIIDAGHGGIDGGTQTKDGVLEKDINLSIAMKLSDVLTSFGYNVIMTRKTDASIHSDGVTGIRNQKISDIKNRLHIIESTENAIFISIHQNYFSQSKYNGAQIFYSKNNPLSEKLAQSIRTSIISSLQKDNTREIKQSGKEIYLLNKATVPAVMVECGFLSNKEEADLLITEKYQHKIAFFIATGITDFIKTSEEL